MLPLDINQKILIFQCVKSDGNPTRVTKFKVEVKRLQQSYEETFVPLKITILISETIGRDVIINAQF